MSENGKDGKKVVISETTQVAIERMQRYYELHSTQGFDEPLNLGQHTNAKIEKKSPKPKGDKNTSTPQK